MAAVIDDLNVLEPSVLYDVFYEAGTRLGGVYVALADKAQSEGDAEAEQRYINAHHELMATRRSIEAGDQEQQTHYIQVWNEYAERLGRNL